MLDGFGSTVFNSLLESSGQELGILNNSQYAEQFHLMKNHPSSNVSRMTTKHSTTFLSWE